MKEFLVAVQLKGKRTQLLKDHIVSKRITADSPEEAIEKATRGKIFEEEGFEVIEIRLL